jgi:CelD/BcsL family acetyltransferase involved in cellulose biosynthesis
MYHTRITPSAMQVENAAGFPHALDGLAEVGLARHRFLRAAWFAAGVQDGGSTLMVRREDGHLLAAIPTVPFGPALIGARNMPGSYWPFRGMLAAPDAAAHDFAHALSAPEARALGPVLRLGPVPEHDPAARLLIKGARQAGWRVLTHSAGTIWTIDLHAQRARGGPSKSTRRKLRRYEAPTNELGTVEWRYVRGSDWDESALEQMGAIEAASWIGTNTDGSGAKFMRPHQRALWRTALADPRLAEMLCAMILLIDGRAVAFNFELDDSPVQYRIAGSLISELRGYHVGKLTNYCAISDAIAAGQSVMDMGAGNSGYKTDRGAVATYDPVDHLFVLSSSAARLIAPWWARQGV